MAAIFLLLHFSVLAFITLEELWLSTPPIYNSGIIARETKRPQQGAWEIVVATVAIGAAWLKHQSVVGNLQFFGFSFDKKKTTCYPQVFLLFKLSRLFNIFVRGNKLWWETLLHSAKSWNQIGCIADVYNLCFQKCMLDVVDIWKVYAQ